jgi:hypothetical protein
MMLDVRQALFPGYRNILDKSNVLLAAVTSYHKIAMINFELKCRELVIQFGKINKWPTPNLAFKRCEILWTSSIL